MARYEFVAVPVNAVTQLTNANATAISFVNRGSDTLLIFFTADATTPTNLALGIPYPPGEGQNIANLASWCHGITAVRVWAYSAYVAGGAFVDHD
jgi:hypothetical protein